MPAETHVEGVPIGRQEVLEIVDAGYYLLTGRSLLDERADIYLLNRMDYLAWIDDHYSERFALNELGKYVDILAEREETKAQAAGLKVSRFGKMAVVVDAERDIANVIGSLAHELGHMRQTFLNPNQDDVTYGSYEREALQEAQAQQFERAFWLGLEAFTGVTLLSYPDYQGFRDLIGNRFDFWYGDPNQDEHFLGYLLQWLVVLEDPIKDFSIHVGQWHVRDESEHHQHGKGEQDLVPQVRDAHRVDH